MKTILNTRKRIGTLPNLYLSGCPAEYVNKAKILGVMVDNILTWKPHVLVQNYTKYVLPKMEYCSTIYGTAFHSTIARLDVIQNSAIRIEFGAGKTTPATFLLSENGLADLET